jgi:hypothetical protein
MKPTRILLGLTVVISLLAGCSSGETTKQDGLQPTEVTDSTVPVEGTTHSPALEKLTQLFTSLGYEGVGLQYESDATLDLLQKVFSDSRTKGHQIKLIYTGLHLAYDSRHQSLTVGGTSDAEMIVSFIQKKVPALQK